MTENNQQILELKQAAEDINSLIESINFWNKKLKKAIEIKDANTIYRSFFELHFISTTILNLSKLEMTQIKEIQHNNDKKSLTQKEEQKESKN